MMEFGLNHLFIHGIYHLMRWGGLIVAVYMALRLVDGLFAGAEPFELTVTALAGALALLIRFAVGRLKDDVLQD